MFLFNSAGKVLKNSFKPSSWSAMPCPFSLCVFYSTSQHRLVDFPANHHPSFTTNTTPNIFTTTISHQNHCRGPQDGLTTHALVSYPLCAAVRVLFSTILPATSYDPWPSTSFGDLPLPQAATIKPPLGPTLAPWSCKEEVKTLSWSENPLSFWARSSYGYH